MSDLQDEVERYTIMADAEQLDGIGICYDISGLSGVLVKKYHTGYYAVSVKYNVGKFEFESVFDIPKKYLKNESNC